MFAIKKIDIYYFPSSQSALRHLLHSHKNNTTPLDNKSTDNVFNSMFTPQLVGFPSSGLELPALALKRVTSVKSGSLLLVLDAAGGDGLQTAATAGPR